MAPLLEDARIFYDAEGVLNKTYYALLFAN